MGTVAVPSHPAAEHTKIEGSGPPPPAPAQGSSFPSTPTLSEVQDSRLWPGRETAVDLPHSQMRKDYETSEEESVYPLPTTS